MQQETVNHLKKGKERRKEGKKERRKEGKRERGKEGKVVTPVMNGTTKSGCVQKHRPFRSYASKRT